MWTVRSTRPISFNAWCTLCWRAYEPSRCRIKEGEAVRAWIEATTRTVSSQARAFLGATRVYGPRGGRRAEPEVLIGWPNRFMVATYVLWIGAVATTRSGV